jgi:phospholipase D1/2
MNCLTGRPTVYDIAEHFVLRWNFVKRDKAKRNNSYPWITLERREGQDEDLVGVQRPKFAEGGYVHHPLTKLSTKHLDNRGTVNSQIVRSSSDWSSGILTEHSILNAYREIILNAEHFVYIENQFFITATGDQQSPVHNNIGEAIVEACVRAHNENRKFRVIIVIPAVPGFAGDLRDDAAIGTRAIMDYQYKSILRGEHSIFERIRAQGGKPEEQIFVFNLRSYDRLDTTPEMLAQEEKSGVSYQQVQQAQASEIMSKDANPKPELGSTKSSATSVEKHDDSGDEAQEEEVDKKRQFEEHRDDEAHEKDNPTKLNRASTIAQDAMLGTKSVTEEPWPENAEDLERRNFVQEELYIHAKVMIADDKIFICGSSNLNDRSQLGTHDSELSMIVEDTDAIDSMMDGKPYKAGKLPAMLRRRLWREHLGLLPPQDYDGSKDPNAQPPGDSPNDHGENDPENEIVMDPLSDKFWDLWTSTATTNTDIFRELFHADPDNSSKLFRV